MRGSGFTLNYFSIFKSVTIQVIFLISCAATAAAEGIAVIPDQSTVIQIVNFVLLIWVLNVIVYKPIRGILIRRKEKIDGLEKSIETKENSAIEKDKAYGAGLKDARSNGLKEKESLLNAAAAEEQEIIGKINEKAQENLKEIREKIRKETEEVRTALQQEVDTFAEAIGQKILGREV